MVEVPDPRLFPYADHVLDRVESEREHGTALREAVGSGEPLLLDFHPHSDGSGQATGWCAAVRVARDGRALVHLRGLVKRREECAPMARVLAGLMTSRYRLENRPRIVLDGTELYG